MLGGQEEVSGNIGKKIHKFFCESRWYTSVCLDAKIAENVMTDTVDVAGERNGDGKSEWK